MTVTQLSSYLKGVFDDEELLHDVTLSGEVAEVSYSDKHTFLVLSEGDVSVRCVHFFARDAIQKGVRAALRGSVRFYDKRSSVSFSYSEFFLCGEGAKNAELAKLKEKLKSQGLFENRPQLPKYVLDVVAVTSPDGAAIRDFIRVVHGRAPFVRIRVYPARVQGAGAAAGIAAAIKKLQGACDAIVLCRGGGSDEDLDCFNDEALAVAVANSKTPVISAVGHEVDYTLCDFCAGTRAGTPSIAGQIVAARANALTDGLIMLLTEAWDSLSARYAAYKAGLDRLVLRITAAIEKHSRDSVYGAATAARRGYYALEKRFAANVNRLTTAVSGLTAAIDGKINDRQRHLDKLAAVLSALDPTRLKPGYAAVFAGEASVRGAAQLKRGDELRLVFADGEATATVTGAKAAAERR